MTKKRPGLIKSFPPVAQKNATTLILGSMPGKASLEAEEYYAHPRNLFWPLITTVLGSEDPLAYPERLKLLHQSRIALWDVLDTCLREGSLDSAIRQPQPNDFENFFTRHPDIRHIFFNGQKAEKSFIKAAPRLYERFNCVRLPSTSPANASIPYEVKLEQWRQITHTLSHTL